MTIALPTNGSGVCAVVVTYKPDGGILPRLHGVAVQVEHLIIVDNSGSEATARLPEDHLLPENSIVVRNPDNRGIAAGLNQGLQLAAARNCSWLLTLDQDSECRNDMVRTLCSVVQHVRPLPAVIGGNYFDPKRRRHEVEPNSQPGAHQERKTVITSGCLVQVALARAIGGFREDYFIDQVDHEFCLRVRSRGRRVAISRRPVMTHSVGDGSGLRLPLIGQRFPAHSNTRRYYIVRNSLVTIASFWRREPIWCLKRSIRLLFGIVGLVLIGPERGATLKASLVGARHALRRRMGPCTGSF